MKNGRISHWMSDQSTPSYSPLENDAQYDVCVVGGGFTGLWTAYHLSRLSPDLRVVLLEARVLGYGASGRNGGWLSHLLPGPAAKFAASSPAGLEGARRLQRQLIHTVQDVLDVCETEGIEADQRQVGNLVVARDRAALGRLRQRREADLHYGLTKEEEYLLGADEVRNIIEVQGALGGLYNTPPARIHPGKLVRGLGEVCASKGVTIHENSPVTKVGKGEVQTERARIQCETVLICTEAYAHEFQIDGFTPRAIPINSSMIITAPISSDDWEKIGWRKYELFSDAAHAFTYAQRTDDGRIAIGGRGVPYRFNSGTGGFGRTPRKTAEMLRDRVAAYFPEIEFDVEHVWSGSLGVSRDWCANVSVDAQRSIGVASGYAGHGVTPTYLAGEILAEKAVTGVSRYDDLPLVNHAQPKWEPEPLRWLGINATYKLFEFADRIEEKSRKPSTSLLARIGAKVSGM